MKSITLVFDKDLNIEVPVKTTTIDGVEVECVSAIFPVGKSVLIAEYGLVSLIGLLNNSRNGAKLNVVAKTMIIGVGNEVPAYVKVGMRFYPKMRESHMLRDVYDPTNDYSFEKLVHRAEKDKELLAAISISGDKARSRVGLKMPTMASVNPEDFNDIMRNKSYGDALYRGKEIPFINYKMMDFHNVDAIIIESEIEGNS
jgi:hypothetical protein